MCIVCGVCVCGIYEVCGCMWCVYVICMVCLYICGVCVCVCVCVLQIGMKWTVQVKGKTSKKEQGRQQRMIVDQVNMNPGQRHAWIKVT